jgi:hypothetical protein
MTIGDDQALHEWMEARFAERKAEPNSGLGSLAPLSEKLAST